MGVRVHHLAKELGMSSKELIAFLHSQGHKVKSHMSSVEETVANILRDRHKPKSPPKEKAEPAAKGAARKGEKKPAAASAKSAAKKEPKEPVAAEFGKPSREGEDVRDRGRVREGKDGAGAQKRRRIRYFPDEFSQVGPRPGRRRPRRSGDGRGRSETSAPVKIPEKVEVFAPVSVKDLSQALGVKAQVLVKKLFEKGKPVTINQYLDEETVMELGIDLGSEITVRRKEEELEEAVRNVAEYESAEKDLIQRAPVVTFLGHVDHGKTSLLDKIRETSVTAREEGGITQHIGAYRVDKEKVHVTFIDTPGHKAFTEMRARGANITDIAVLVVAADDGPMPQTEEAIDHARAAGVPIVVALNKIDKANANPQRAKDALSKLGLIPVEWNGSTEYVEVSAITGQGIEDLLETLTLEAEILELKADPGRPAVGVVLEAEATTHRGVVATVLVQNGTLRVGDYLLCGASHGRVRNLILNGTVPVDEAGPSYPVQVIGLSQVPAAGEKFYVFKNEKQARQLADDRDHRMRESERAQRQQVTLENVFERLRSEEVKELRLILKADVRGSVEALKSALEQLTHEEVKIVILHAGVGAITQEDVHLASASQAVVIGFHVTADDRARQLADENDVDIRHYRVIYEAIEDVRAALESRLAPERAEERHGSAEIRQVYRASRLGNIAGCMVSDGFILRNDKVRLIRDGKVIHTGELDSLRRFKDDVREVKEGYECGIKIAGYNDIEVGDVIESFTIVEKQRTL